MKLTAGRAGRTVLTGVLMSVTGWLCGGCAAPASVDTVASNTSDDPFLWLEDVTGERALDWVRAQNARGKKTLASDPLFDELYNDALSILGNEARIPYGSISAGHVYNFWQDTEHVRGIVRRMPLADYVAGGADWEVLLDVDELARVEGRNWVYGGSVCLPPAHDPCLMRLSDGGTDAATYREYSVAQRAFVADGFVVPPAKSGVQWIDADTLLVASDFGADSFTESGYPLETRIWQRGTPLASARRFVRGRASDVGVFPVVLRNADTAYPATIQSLSFFEYRIHMQLEDGGIVQLPLPARTSLVGMINGDVVAHLKQDWEYQGRTFKRDSVVALGVGSGAFAVSEIYAPAASEAVAEVEAGASDVFVVVLDNVIGKLKRISLTADGWQARTVALPDNGTVSISSTNGDGNDLLVSYESLTVPDRLFYVGADDAISTAYALPEMYRADDVVVEQRFATSADGTRVPYFVMGRADVLAAGDAPTVQYGYGGFDVPILPSYYTDPARPQHGALAGKLWVRRGGVLVLANIRGGGEYGPRWHQAALKGNRQRSFDDFIAVSEALVASGLTRPEKLGAIGRSNGGLLMGVVLTQRPDLYGAIDCGVPLLDMLRYHKLLAGASWTGEYGNPDVPEERAYLAAYSPYQALRADQTYPRVLFYTSTKDDRVHPGHARKMAARMLSMGHRFEYYENTEGGHGGTANQEQLAYRTALEYRFFFDALMH